MLIGYKDNLILIRKKRVRKGKMLENCWISGFTLLRATFFLHESRSQHCLKWSASETLRLKSFKHWRYQDSLQGQHIWATWGVSNRWIQFKIIIYLKSCPSFWNTLYYASPLCMNGPGAIPHSINHRAGDETVGIQVDATDLIQITYLLSKAW